MIVEKTNPRYASDETCGECDEVFYTDGAYKMHTCPECGSLTPACNVCNDHNNCDLCPLQANQYKVSISIVIDAKTEKQAREMFLDIIADCGFGSPDVELIAPATPALSE